MFGLSFSHLFILAIIAIVFIGPEQLPEVARTFARLLNDWRRATTDIKSTLAKSLEEPPKPYVPPPAPEEIIPHAPNQYPGAIPDHDPDHVPVHESLHEPMHGSVHEPQPEVSEVPSAEIAEKKS